MLTLTFISIKAERTSVSRGTNLHDLPRCSCNFHCCCSIVLCSIQVDEFFVVVDIDNDEDDDYYELMQEPVTLKQLYWNRFVHPFIPPAIFSHHMLLSLLSLSLFLLLLLLFLMSLFELL